MSKVNVREMRCSFWIILINIVKLATIFYYKIKCNTAHAAAGNNTLQGNILQLNTFNSLLLAVFAELKGEHLCFDLSDMNHGD